MLVYYFVPFIVSNRYLLFWVSNGHNSVTVQNRTHVYMNFFHHKDLGNRLLQLCPKVVKHPVYVRMYVWMYESRYKIMPPIFSSENINISEYVINFTHIIWTSFTNLRLFSTKPSLSTHYSMSTWDAVCRSCRTLSWCVGALRTRYVT